MSNILKKAISVLMIAVMVICSVPLAGFIGFDLSGVGESFKAQAYSHNQSQVKSYEELDARYDDFVYVGVDVIEVENEEFTDGYVEAGDWLEYRVTVLSDLYVGNISPIIIYEKDFFDVRVITSTTPRYHDNYGNSDYEANLKFEDGKFMNPDHPYAAPDAETSHTLTAMPATRISTQMGFCEIDSETYGNWDLVKSSVSETVAKNKLVWTMKTDAWITSWYVKVQEGLAEGDTGKSFSDARIWRFNLNSATGKGDSRRPADIATATDPDTPFSAARGMHIALDQGTLSHLILEDAEHTFTIGHPPLPVEIFYIEFMVDGKYYDSRSYEAGNIIDFPDDPEKDGYTFAGWEWKDHGGNVIEPCERMPYHDLVLTAKWTENTEKPSHNVEYYLAVGGALYDTLSFEEGEAIVHPAAPSAEGFTFKGWADEDGNALGDNMVMGEEDIKVYAQFEVNTYNVKYIVDGEVYAEYDIKYQAEVTIPEDPKKDGYIFGGWDPEVESTMPAFDLMYSANWFHDTDDGEYTATFLYHNGETYKNYVLNEGDEIPVPEAPEKFGYVFKGWEPEVPATMPAEDIVFEPQYEIDEEFVAIAVGGSVISGSAVAGTIVGANIVAITGVSIVGGVLVIAGAAGLVKHTHTATYIVDGEVYKTYKVIKGTKIPVPASPVKDGFVFEGWNPDVPEKMGDDDVSFEAVWSEISVDIEIPETGSVSGGLAAFAVISAAAAAAYVITARKKKD